MQRLRLPSRFMAADSWPLSQRDSRYPAIDVELCDCFLEYGETTAEMALMFTFVLFGTSLIWTGLSIAGAGTLLFAAAVFIARFVAFIPALLPAPLSWKHRLLIAWFGPRGLSSLLLVLLPVFAGLPGAEGLLTICCLVVLCSVVLHGLSPMVLIRSPQRLTCSSPASAPVPSQPCRAFKCRCDAGVGTDRPRGSRVHHH